MKRSNLSKVVGASVLSLSVALLPLSMPAHAQSGGGAGGSTGGSTSGSTSGSTTTGTTDSTRNNDFDWGWLGLLGLIGLAGLTGRNRTEPARYRDPDEVTRPGSRL